MNKYNSLLVLLVFLFANGLHSSDQSVKDFMKKTAHYFVLGNTALYTVGTIAVPLTTKVLGSAPLRHSISAMKSMQRDVTKAVIKNIPLTGVLAAGAAIVPRDSKNVRS